MNPFLDFLKWHNNRDVVPTLDAMTKMIQFYHSKQIDMLKRGYTLPNLADRILHSLTDAAFFPVCEQDKEYDNYIRNWLTGGPSIIFTRYAKVGETKIRASENACKSIVGIDASQLYSFSMTKQMPTGLYTKWVKEKPLLFEDIENGVKTRERDNGRREYLQGLGYTVVEIWECQWKTLRRKT